MVVVKETMPSTNLKKSLNLKGSLNLKKIDMVAGKSPEKNPGVTISGNKSLRNSKVLPKKSGSRRKRTVALVFSGGAIRGFSEVGAYIAIDEFLQENNFEVKALAGTSFGAIVAGFVASGYSGKDLYKISETQWNKMHRILDIDLFGNGLLKGENFRKALELLTHKKRFSQVSSDLSINAVDIISGKEFFFSRKGLYSLDGTVVHQGDLLISDAMRSSCSIPVVFPPVRMNGLFLVDGGLINPLPLHLIDMKKYDLVIAIDVCMANFDFISGNDLSKRGIIEQSVSIIQRQYHFDNIDCAQRDNGNLIVIRPKVGQVNPMKKEEFKRAIECGYYETKHYLDILKD